MSLDERSTSRARRPAHEPPQSSHGSAAGDQSHAHLPLGQNRFFPARETHVAGERDFASVPRCPTSDQGDRHDRRMRQPHEDVRPRLQPCRPLWYAGQIFKLGVEIAVVQKEPLDGAVEDEDPDLFVGFDRRHDLAKFKNELRPHHVQRWIVECDPPIGGRHPGQFDLRRFRCRAQMGLLSLSSMLPLKFGRDPLHCRSLARCASARKLASRTRTNGLCIWRAWRGLKKAFAKLKILRGRSALRPLCLNSPLEMAEI